MKTIWTMIHIESRLYIILAVVLELVPGKRNPIVATITLVQALVHDLIPIRIVVIGIDDRNTLTRLTNITEILIFEIDMLLE
mgnify:CR=1 FL=1|jgi:hypothetical protein